MPSRVAAIVAVALVAVAASACSGSDGDDDGGNTVTRIDGPASVDDGAGADQD